MLAARNRLVVPVSASAPITYSDTGAGTKGGASTWTYTHSGIAGNCILVFVSSGPNVATITAKVGGSSGTPMTQIGSNLQFVSGSVLAIFSLLNSGLTGSQTIYLSSSSPLYIAVNSISYKNVSSVSSLVTNTGTGTAATISLSPSASQLAVAAFSAYSAQNISSASPNQRFNISAVNYGNFPLAAADGTTSPSATLPSSVQWGAAGVLLS